jgi:hypothetical protein
MHGGKTPVALEKAAERIRALAAPAITAVADLIQHSDSDATRLAAAKLALELNGFKAKVEVQGEHEVTLRVVRTEQPIVVQTRALGD